MTSLQGASAVVRVGEVVVVVGQPVVGEVAVGEVAVGVGDVAVLTLGARALAFPLVVSLLDAVDFLHMFFADLDDGSGVDIALVGASTLAFALVVALLDVMDFLDGGGVDIALVILGALPLALVYEKCRSVFGKV